MNSFWYSRNVNVSCRVPRKRKLHRIATQTAKKIARKAQRHFAYFHVTLHFFLLHPVAMSTATIFRFFWFILYITLDGFTKCYTRILQAPNYSTRRPLSKFATKCKSFLHQTFEFKACNFVCYIFFSFCRYAIYTLLNNNWFLINLPVTSSRCNEKAYIIILFANFASCARDSFYYSIPNVYK